MSTETSSQDSSVEKITEKISETKLDRWSEIDDDETEVKVDRCDESSPLFSAKSFEQLGLSDELLKGVYAMGFTKPSRIQEKALPLILSNPPQNLIAQAQSGSGKTAAFSLCMLSRVDPSKNYPQALCLCPARELALQIFEVVQQMGKFTQIKVACCVSEDKVNPSNKTPTAPKSITEQIVIGTPGKILSLIGKKIKPDGINLIVLDEADMMLDGQGLRDQSVRIYKLLHPKNCQYILFSATYREDVGNFAEQVVPAPRNIIRLQVKEIVWKKIRQYYIDCSSSGDRLYILQDIYKYIEFAQTIVFVNTKKSANEISKLLCEQGFQVAVLTGDMKPSERDVVINQFRGMRAKVLITTNVLARGIDIPTVELVINYDIPLLPEKGQNQKPQEPKVDYETYIHRIGRAGRYDRIGFAINLVYPSKESLLLISLIEKTLGQPITPWPADKIVELSEKMKELDSGPQYH